MPADLPRPSAPQVPVEPPATSWVFPDGGRLDELDDLAAAGADLEPGTVLAAYRRGLFPMPSGEPGDPMYWWSPVERGVLPLDGLRLTRSLRRAVQRFEIRVDTACEEVIDACADPGRDSGWISPEIRAAYLRLHELGWVHSVEAWCDGRLAGGLYGVAIGGLFAGESMFHRERDASKVALVGLVRLLADEHAAARVVDTQWVTPHLASLGVVPVPRTDYLDRLTRALAVPPPAGFVRTGRDRGDGHGAQLGPDDLYGWDKT